MGPYALLDEDTIRIHLDRQPLTSSDARAVAPTRGITNLTRRRSNPHNGVVLSSDGTLEGNDVCGFDESQRQTIAQLHGSPHLQTKTEIDVSVIEPKSGAHSDQAASSRV